MSDQFPALFKPLQIRHKTLRNRIVFGSHTANMSDMGLPSERHRGYYEERARGGGAGVFDISKTPAEKVWENKNLRNHMASSVLWEGHLYGVDENQLRCVDFNTGEVKWTDKVSGKGTLSMADGKLLVLSERGELLVANLSPTGFKPISRAQVVGGKCWTAPTLANGKIYVRTGPGDLVCVDVSGK